MHHSFPTHYSTWSSPHMLKYPQKACCQKAPQNLSEILAVQGKTKALSEKERHPFMETELAFSPIQDIYFKPAKCSHHSHLQDNLFSCKESLKGERDTKVHCGEGKGLYNPPKKTNTFHNHSCKKQWESPWGEIIKTITPSLNTHHHFRSQVVKMVAYLHPCFFKQLY